VLHEKAILVSDSERGLCVVLVDLPSELVDGQGRMGFEVDVAYCGRALVHILAVVWVLAFAVAFAVAFTIGTVHIHGI
jgi:hypothetical protein